jgi:hypothetical protein
VSFVTVLQWQIEQQKLGQVGPPEIRYAKSGDVNIAYSIVGDGPFDLVFVSGWALSNLEHAWESTPAEFFNRLASFSRALAGCGLGFHREQAPVARKALQLDCPAASEMDAGAGDQVPNSAGH